MVAIAESTPGPVAVEVRLGIISIVVFAAIGLIAVRRRTIRTV